MRMARTIATVVAVTFVLAAAAHASGKVVVIGVHTAQNAVPWLGDSWNACRFQALWFQSDINYAGYINMVEFDKSNASGGTFYNVRVWLCLTAKTGLEARFDNNYTGNTPVQVLNASSVTLSGNGYWDLGITPYTFYYNNSDNLLMEVRWNGDSGDRIRCWTSGQPNCRVSAANDNANNGYVWNSGQCIRLHIGTMTGLEPTSLGRVKTLFR